jgi:hypothetical protein
MTTITEIRNALARHPITRVILSRADERVRYPGSDEVSHVCRTYESPALGERVGIAEGTITWRGPREAGSERSGDSQWRVDGLCDRALASRREPTPAAPRSVRSALLRYGRTVCEQAYREHLGGSGANTVSWEVAGLKRGCTNGADSAIAAGRWLAETSAAQAVAS